MSYTLYTYLPNYRAHKILIAAAYNDVKIDVPEFKLHQDNLTPEFLKKNPLGKVPVLDTPHGPVAESNAIARYVAGLRGDTDLLGASYFERAQVDQWIDFSAHELEPTRSIWLYPIYGLMPFDQAAYEAAKQDLAKTLAILDKHLETRTFLVGHRITLADITVVSALVDLFTKVFDPAYRKPFVNVLRWFTTCTNQPQFADVLGTVDLCKKEERAAGAGASSSSSSSKPAKEEKSTASAPAADAAGGDDYDDEAPKKKVKNPLDELPPSTMVLDSVKKLFWSQKPYNPEFFNLFWPQFDDKGYSIYTSAYQYNDENKVFWMSSNLLGGWLQRLEELRKYAMGAVFLTGTDENTPPFNFHGVWIFRGTTPPAEFTECPDSSYHTLTKVDTSSEAGRKLVQDYLVADKINGETVLDRRYFK